MKNWFYILISSLILLFSCNNGELELESLIVGAACEGEMIMQKLDNQWITVETGSDFEFLNQMASAVGYPSLDISDQRVRFGDFVDIINAGPGIFMAVETAHHAGHLPKHISDHIRIQTSLGKDRCCTVQCECGTVYDMQITMYDIGLIRGITTCRFFRGLAEKPFEEVWEQFEENRESLPPDILELGPALEGIWSPGEACDYDVDGGACIGDPN